MPSYPSLPFPVITRGSKRSHAKRSCLACRRQKARCELPPHAMDFPSSRDELPIESSCHRCKTLGIPCIVYDEQLKGTRQKVTRNANPVTSPQTLSISAGPSPRSPRLSVGAAQPECELSSSGFFHLFHQELNTVSTSPQAAVNTIPTQGLHLRHRKSMCNPDVSLMWRPIALLAEHLSRQPEFGSRSRPDSGIASAISSPADIVDARLGNRIETSFQPYYVWIPHLPSPNDLRQQHLKSPTLSSSLLLGAMYLLILKDLSDETQMEDTRTRLTRLVQRDLTRVLLFAPVDVHAVQALELLAVYAPFDFGGEVPNGTALLAVAKRIAMALQLADAPAAVVRLHASNNTDRGALDEVLRRATIYYSLQVWELSFAFNDPHLSQIPQESEPPDAADVMNPKNSPPQEVLFRVVGRIAIAHRLHSLRKFYDWSRDISFATNMGSLHSTLDKISNILNDMFSEVEAQQRQQRFAFSPYMGDPNVALICEWIEMETRSGHLMVLGRGLSSASRPRHLFVSGKWPSTFDILTHVIATPPMSTFLLQWGHRLVDCAEKLLAVFVGMEQHNPFVNIHSPISPLDRSRLHAYGAPPVTTCAMITGATTSITETHAALFMMWAKTTERVESYLVIMRQAAKCLAGMDPSRSMAMGSIPAASAQVVITMASAVANWWTIIRNEQSKRLLPTLELLPADLTEDTSVSLRGEHLATPTASTSSDSALDVPSQWPVQSLHLPSFGDVSALDSRMLPVPSESPQASEPAFDCLLDVYAGSFDWSTFNMPGPGQHLNASDI